MSTNSVADFESLEQEATLAVSHRGLVTKGFVQQGELHIPTNLRPSTISMAEHMHSQVKH